MGRNGAGKSSLLKIIMGQLQPTSGSIARPDGFSIGYVPQHTRSDDQLSGGEGFNQALTEALSTDPDMLCLDEPTNHLDQKNRRSLIKMLTHFYGTLLIASHDPELLRTCIDEVWFIDEEKITIFSGGYDSFLQERGIAQQQQQEQRDQLKKEKLKAKKALMKEQERTGSSKRANRYENDKNILGAMKQSSNATAGKQQKKIHERQNAAAEGLKNVRDIEIIKPRFNLEASSTSATRTLFSVAGGACGYKDTMLLSSISFHCGAKDRIALMGSNGSGKSTLLKGLLKANDVVTTGDWFRHAKTVGYLDQHYTQLNDHKTVFETISEAGLPWDDYQVRRHLNDFLFRSNQEVNTKVANLSGGEKARLSLALIAAQNPEALLLDEATNNVDFETREHIIQVLMAYPGALIVISHDEDFLRRINLETFYEVANRTLRLTTLD